MVIRDRTTDTPTHWVAGGPGADAFYGVIRHHTIGLRSDLHAELDALPPTGRPQLNIQQDDRMSGSAAEPPSTVAWQEALDIDAEVLQWSADNEGEAGVEALSIHTPKISARF